MKFAALILLSLWLPLRAFAAEPLRIVSLSPNLTELTFDAGAGKFLVGAVEYSDYPEAAKKVPRIGDAFRVDLERVLSLHPTHILAWRGGTPQALIDKLRALQLNVVLIQCNRLEEIGTAIRFIGKLAGTQGAAQREAERFEQQLAALRSTYANRKPLSVFIEVDEHPLYTVNREQLLNQIVELCGGKNIFAGLTQLAPTVSEEAVIAANPDVILSTNDTVKNPRALWAAWPQMRAVSHENVYTLPADDVSRATTRTLRGIEATCGALEKARTKGE